MLMAAMLIGISIVQKKGAAAKRVVIVDAIGVRSTNQELCFLWCRMKFGLQVADMTKLQMRIFQDSRDQCKVSVLKRIP